MSLPVKLVPGFVILLAALITGCSTYQSVTAYFNTYYNASKLFSDAVTEIEKAPQAGQDTNYFAPYNITKNTEDKLDKVIEKCSKLIEFYPNSTWIPEAIMMIGRSYVYKGEDESALRKFSELLDNFPSSGYRFDARLWSAIAKYQGKRQDDALKNLKDLFPDARSEGKDDIMLKDLMLQGQIFMERGEYDQAAAVFGPATEVSGDGKLRAIAQSQLALCYERLGDKEKAAAAYGKVRKFSPDFTLEFKSRLKEAMMLSGAGQYDRAFDRLDDLRQEPLKPEERGLVELEAGNTYRRMGDTAHAIAFYSMIDTAYRRTDASAKSYFHQAMIAEKQAYDFASARKLFDKAKNEFAGSEITPLAQKQSLDLENYFRYYQGLHTYDSLLVVAIHRDSIAAIEDSLRAKGDSLALDSLASLLRSTGDSLGAQGDSLQRALGALTSDSLSRDTTARGRQLRPPVLRELPATPFKPKAAQTDSVQHLLPTPGMPGAGPPRGELALEQLHLDSVTANPPGPRGAGPTPGMPGAGPPRGELALEQLHRDSVTANAPRPRRAGPTPGMPGAGPPRGELALEQLHRDSVTANAPGPPGARGETAEVRARQGPLFRRGAPGADSLTASRIMEEDREPGGARRRGSRDTSRVQGLGPGNRAPQQTRLVALSPDSLRSMIAMTEFELGGLFFLELNFADSAITWYQKVVNDYPASPLVPRALYAMAEIHRNANDSTVVDSLYDIILNRYGQTAYAGAVNKFLGKNVEFAKLDSAELSYTVAESLLQKGQPADAISLLRTIPGKYPVSPFVPKSLYAIGWIYESVLVDNDSASIWYKKLLKQYPTSVYADAVQGKVAVKDDPKSLSQYVKIKEIQPLAKLPEKKIPGKKEGTVDEQDEEDQGTDEEEIQRARRHEDTKDEDSNDDDDDSSDSDDDNN